MLFRSPGKMIKITYKQILEGANNFYPENNQQKIVNDSIYCPDEVAIPFEEANIITPERTRVN